jgi:PAS domain S-box-containing protein
MKPSANEFVVRRSLSRYGLSVLAVGIALGVALLLEHFHFRTPAALLLMLAVAIGSWYGGQGPGVLAAILSTVAYYWYFVEPVRTIYIYSSEIPHFVTFVAFAVLLSRFGATRRRVEARLRERAALLDLTHDTVFVMDMDGVIRYWNRGAEERYGWTAEQAVGRNVHDLLKTVFPASLEELKDEVTRVGRWEGELRHTRKDGTQVVVASRWSLERDEQGAPLAILETNNDITERKRAEEAVRRSEQQFRDMIETIPAMAWMALADGANAFVTRHWAEYTGISSEETTSSGWLTTVHPEDRQPYWEKWRACLATGETFECDVRFRCAATGEYRWFLSRAVPMRDNRGNIAKWFGVLTDIEDRKRAEEALRRTGAYLADAQRLTHTGVWAGDRTSKPLYWSEEVFRIFGFDPQQGLPTGEQALERIHPEDFDKFQRSTINEKGYLESEYRIVLPDGTLKYVFGSAHPVLDRDGEVVEVVGVVVDITERKHAEEALRRLNRELRAISNCNQTLLRTTDERSLLEEICRIVCDEAAYSMAFVAYAEHDEAKSVRPVAWAGAEVGYIATAGITWADTERGLGQTGTAIRSGKTCCIQDFATDPRMAPWREGLLQRGFCSGIAVPLKDEEGRAFGSLTIHSGQPNAFTPEEIRLLEELAGDMAFGIVKLRSQAARKRAEEEVTLLSFALANVHEAAFLIDDSGHFRYVNEEACRALDYTRAQLLGMGVADIDPDFPMEGWPEHWRDLREHRLRSFETRHRTRDGRIFPVEVSANYFEHDGRAYHLALVRDITERKRAEEKLRQQEQALRQVLDFMPDMVAEFDSDRKRLYANRPTLDYFGVTLEEWRNTSDLYLFYHPDDRERIESIYARSESALPREYEARMRRADGEYRWFFVQENPLRDEEGRITRWYVSGTDIEDRKQAEQALRRSEERLRLTLESTQIGIFDWDVAHDVWYASPVYYTALGYEPRETRGDRTEWVERLHPEDRERVTRILRAILAGEIDRYEYEARLRHADGSFHWVQVRALGIEHDSDGKVSRELGVRIDITERKRAEEALRRSEAYLADSQRLTQTGSFTYLPGGAVLYCSEEAMRIWGFDRQHAIPNHEMVRQRIHPDDRRRVRERADKAVEAKTGWDDEFRIVLPDGTVKHIYAIHHPVFSASGELVEVAGTHVDITERKRAEEALRESETRFRTFVDHAGDALFVYDLEHRTVVDVNRSACESLGYTRQELIGKTPLAFHLDSHQKEMESTAARAAAGETVFDRHLHRRKDGSTFPVEVHTSLVSYGGRRFLLKVARDITDRVRAEEALRRSEAYLAEAQRLSHTGAWATDAVPEPLYWSEELFRLYGLDSQQGFPTHEQVLQRVHPEDRDRYLQALHRVIHQRVDSEVEFRTVLPDGTIRYLYGLGHPILNANGDVVEVVGTTVDITERKRAEQQRERLRLLESEIAHIDRVNILGELAASISHELNQPIAASILNASLALQWLERDPPDLAEARQRTTRIIEAGTLASEIIDRLRSLYRKEPPKREPLTMNEVIGEMVVLLRGEAIRHAVSLRADLADNLPFVLADRVQIQQVLMNLMLNGIEAMSDTGGILTVKSQLRENGQIEISVSDTGPGLPPGKDRQIFDAFFTTKPQGSGMGLAISKSIVESHGGRIWANGNGGRGATFHFSLPMAPAEASLPAVEV